MEDKKFQFKLEKIICYFDLNFILTKNIYNSSYTSRKPTTYFNLLREKAVFHPIPIGQNTKCSTVNIMMKKIIITFGAN